MVVSIGWWTQSLHRKWLEITKHPFFDGCLGFQVWKVPDKMRRIRLEPWRLEGKSAPDSKDRTNREVLPLRHGKLPKPLILKIPWFSKVRGTIFFVHPFIYKGCFSVSRDYHPKSPRWRPRSVRCCAALPALSTASGHWGTTSLTRKMKSQVISYRIRACKSQCHLWH